KAKATERYLDALSKYKTLADQYAQSYTLYCIATAYNSLREYKKALDYYNQALPLQRQVGNRASEAVTLLNIAKLEREQDNLASARTNIESAIKLVEFIRTNVAGQQLRSSFFQTKRDYYELNIDILMRLHK